MRRFSGSRTTLYLFACWFKRTMILTVNIERLLMYLLIAICLKRKRDLLPNLIYKKKILYFSWLNFSPFLLGPTCRSWSGWATAGGGLSTATRAPRYYRTQSCGSGMFNADQTFFHPGSASKNLSILTRTTADGDLSTAIRALRYRTQCCGSGMFIPDPGSDFFPSRIRIFSIPDPHQKINPKSGF